MLRPPVTINRRRGGTGGGAKPAPAAAAARRAGGPSSRAGGAGQGKQGSAGATGAAGSRAVGVAGQASLEQAQFRLASSRAQLGEYLAGPFKEAVGRRQELQAKRDQLLPLLKQLVAAQEGASTAQVWLCAEKERALEQQTALLEARVRRVQHQRRIQELLLRTDPKLTAAEVKAGATRLARDAYVETVELMAEAVEAQRQGYRELSQEYPQALKADARARQGDIRWAATFLSKLLDGVGSLAKVSDALREQVLGRYLARRHNTRLLEEGLAATRAACRPAKGKWEEDTAQLEARFAAEMKLLRSEAAAAKQSRLEALRDKVEAKGQELAELDAWYNHILDAYEDRVAELKATAAHAQLEAEEWAAMRTEARAFYLTALQEVRRRLHEFELARGAEAFAGLSELLGLVEGLETQMGAQGGEEDEDDDDDEEEEGYEGEGEEAEEEGDDESGSI